MDFFNIKFTAGLFRPCLEGTSGAKMDGGGGQYGTERPLTVQLYAGLYLISFIGGGRGGGGATEPAVDPETLSQDQKEPESYQTVSRNHIPYRVPCHVYTTLHTVVADVP